MFDASRAHVFVRTADSASVLRALDRELRRWKFRQRQTPLPAGYPSQGPREIYEIFFRVSGDCTALALEDLGDCFRNAYAIHCAAPKIPVIASAAFQYGIWDLKGYLDKDLLFKFGDGPDHELAWVGRPLDAEGLDAAERALGGGRNFLQSVIAGRPDRRDLESELALPSLSHGFRELQSDPGDWTWAGWVHDTSPLNR